jgi:S-layer family protein
MRSFFMSLLTFFAAFFMFSLTTLAAAPTGSTAVMQNSTATTVDIVITGTDFDQFISAQSTTADATDLLEIAYNGVNATGAVIDNITTVTATFPISAGTNKSGGNLTVGAGAIEDGADVANLAITIADGSVTDSAQPALLSAVLGTSANRNILTLVYSEPMYLDLNSDGSIDGTDVDGGVAGIVSTVSTGDYANLDGVKSLEKFGDFAAGSIAQSSTGDNTLTVSADGLTMTATFNTLANSYFTSTPTPLSGVFTPDNDATDYVLAQEGSSTANKRVEETATVTSSGSWDLTAPGAVSSFDKMGIASATSDIFIWGSAGSSDFGRYIMFYDTSSTITLVSGASEWTPSDDANFTTMSTDTTTVTGLTNAILYYYRLGAIDTAGNVSLSGEISATAGIENGRPSTPDETPITDDDDDDDEEVVTVVTDDDDDTDDDEEEVEEVEVALSDIANHWAEEEIFAMAASGIVTGNPDETFEPDGNLNRAEAAALMYRVLGLAEPTVPIDTEPFLDVEVGAWYAGYVAGLLDLGLVDGNPDGTYEPVENINRAEFLVMAMNVHNFLYEKTTELDVLEVVYEDIEDENDGWYAMAVFGATAQGFVNGSECGEGMCFNAENNITRAEAAVMLNNIFY